MLKKSLLLFLLISFSGCQQIQSINTTKPLKSNQPVEQSQANNTKNQPQSQIQSPKTPTDPFAKYSNSLYNLIQKPINTTTFELGTKEYSTAKYTRFRATYTVNGIKNSAIINIPYSATLENPAPLLITNHGYIDPKIYTTGRGLKREQNFFANNGYVVVHPDYRNHAFSDKNIETTTDFRFGYVQDSLGAILALKQLNDPRIDISNTFMLGHSMGGGVTMKAVFARPDLIRAAVLYAPVSSNERDNFDKWTRNSYPQASEILETYGDFLENPEFWDSISIDSYFDQFKVPVLIQQGAKDDSTPIEWARDTYQKLLAQKKDVQIIEYPYEGHEFATSFNSFMQSSLDFFNSHLL